jgi:ribosome-binding protein aMBF1 (putative translation factor)
MTKCEICKKTDQEVKLYPGIMRAEMVNLCEECAEDQKIPIIKKPSKQQLTQTQKTYTVRERLDRMQGRQDSTEISGDQMVTQKNLAKLRSPPKKQHHPEILENYYWTLSMARRRNKTTTSQLASKVKVEPHKIRDIERGILPKDFKEIFQKLEQALNIQLLKHHEPKIGFTTPEQNRNKEKEILAQVAQKMKHPETELEITEELNEIKQVQEKIEKQEIKLSKRKNLHNLTLSDLIDRKRAREKYQSQKQESEMFGDDIEINEL